VSGSPPREGRLADVAGALLLGGASQRMGRDKASLRFGPASLAERAAALLAALCEDVALVGGEPPGGTSGRRVSDVAGPQSALRGLVSALDATQASQVLVLATDLPLVTPDLLCALVAWPACDAVIPRTPDGAHPLCARYRREPVLASARANLAAGRLKLTDCLEGLDVAWLAGAALRAVDPDGVALTSVNTEAELERARERIS